MNQRFLFCYVSAFCLTAGLLSHPQRLLAQSDRFFPSADSPLRVDVDLVTLNFTAVDGRQRNFTDLQKEDIVIYEDEVSQEIAFFDTEPMPISLVVLLDVSESIRPYLKQIETTTRVVPDLLQPQDVAAVFAFSDVPNLLQEFTPDRERIRSALHRARNHFAGATNINDSIYVAAKTIRSTPSDRPKVILLISDGKGNRGDRERALAELKASGAIFLAVGVGLASKVYEGSLSLSRWVREAGGSLSLFSQEAEMRQRIRKTLDTVRRQYAAAYIPSNKRRDGTFRRLRLIISEHSPVAAQGITIHGPTGYYAPSEASRNN